MLAIDFGSNSIKVACSGKKLELLRLEQKIDFSRPELRSLLTELDEKFPKQLTVRVTGGKSMILPNEFEGRRIERVNEIQAIAKGGLHLSTLHEAIVVNLGSGTTVVHAKKLGGSLKFLHLGGLALGAESLQALGKLTLQSKNLKQLDELASKGDWTKVDSLISEVTGIKISDKLPLHRPAAHFAKLNQKGARPKKQDLAAGLLNMFATTLICYLLPHAQRMLCKRVVLTGGLTKLPVLMEMMQSFEKETGLRFYMPENAEFTTVIGAVV